MRFLAAGFSALLVAGISSAAFAGPAVDAATRAEALLIEGKTVEAIEALNDSLDKLWQASPLAFRKAVVVSSSSGRGVYEERTDLTFRPDEKMMIYVEPVGYGYGGSGNEGTIDFTGDLAIENETGQVLGEAKDIFSISAPSAQNRREFGMTLSFGVPYLRPGDYKALITLRDKNSDKSATFDVAFKIGLPAGAETAQ